MREVNRDAPKDGKRNNAYPYEEECRKLIGRYFINKFEICYVFSVKKDKTKKQWICEASYIAFNSHIEESMREEGSPIYCWHLRPHYYFDDYTEVTREEYLKIRKVLEMAKTSLRTIANKAIEANKND